ncbi:hypothetical protein ABIC83_002390 [Roseateles asaccharophilus]|uniref:hypothetical protein n=1 Tax=Roseateles asaccharophilus TaxID=582607 RepID=UPI0038387514
MTSKQIIGISRIILLAVTIALVSGEGLYFLIHGRLYAGVWPLIVAAAVVIACFGATVWGVVLGVAETLAEERAERERAAKDEVARRIAAGQPDRTAASQLAIRSWNDTYAVGTEVTYEKSPLEGRVVFQTTTPAYLLGDEAVVELEHIGIALMTKLGPYSQG